MASGQLADHDSSANTQERPDGSAGRIPPERSVGRITDVSGIDDDMVAAVAALYSSEGSFGPTISYFRIIGPEFADELDFLLVDLLIGRRGRLPEDLLPDGEVFSILAGGIPGDDGTVISFRNSWWNQSGPPGQSELRDPLHITRRSSAEPSVAQAGVAHRGSGCATPGHSARYVSLRSLRVGNAITVIRHSAPSRSELQQSVSRR